MRLITLQNATIRHSGTPALESVTFHIDRGEIVTILGPNGSGKSTLLRTLIGALPLSSGSLEKAPGLRIGYVPQKLHIDPTLPLTVRRFLSLPKRIRDDVAEAALADVGIPGLGHRPMAGLSGGQFQRVLLARALLTKPDLLILDEATQGLDQAGSAAFYQKIENVRAQFGCAVLMVSHELHVVMAASDRVVCLNGHVCCEGAPAQVATAPEYKALFGSGTHGTLALYRHEHDHSHECDPACDEHGNHP
ncbi:metal ABC transporter ATP-binding protein [Phaeobacter sp. B1627]|uniref:metal ABC transporter ATP-binding protein n=1 Tax=Phaeobacter sp. B1627 TaxID=2583809 RepID=UPI00111B7B69|nr:metal ABC transporter ATP-binding protein [Phaeobacter sp. B1627]TNJ45921.1 metal ABC transporter ATP-binding protein [Phaeobacter sp. B1627]